MHDLEAPLNAQTPLVPPGGACAASLMNEGPLGGPSISLSSSPQHPQQQPQQQQQQELRHPQQQQQEYEEEERFKFIWVIVKEAAGVDLQKDMQQRLQDMGGGGDEPQHQANAVAAAPQHPTTAAATAEAVEAAAAAAAAKEIGDANEAATTAAAAPLTQSHEESVSGSPAAAAPAPEPAAATGAAGAAGSGARSSSTRSIAYYDLKVPLTGLLALAAAYSSYHMVVIHSLMGPAYVLPAFFAISLLGAVLLYLRNKERFGLLTATGLHAGVDVGVVFVLAELLGIF
ncbi:hypothetical protein, conserved [Eimeria acervulina]|uniref:Uncharacterized protein n=1 Tax=Eimeria acervulina TaxID=5801 RepID=U6GJ53_EIMAC|nr:hypothetical protein, conserved [Eimeria acervulina]CDI79333.1 hypothetical protein, conserved [Eimeria acervulina]